MKKLFLSLMLLNLVSFGLFAANKSFKDLDFGDPDELEVFFQLASTDTGLVSVTILSNEQEIPTYTRVSSKTAVGIAATSLSAVSDSDARSHEAISFKRRRSKTIKSAIGVAGIATGITISTLDVAP